MKITHHSILNKEYVPESHFIINISLEDVEKYGDEVYTEASKEFVKYAKVVQKDRWHVLNDPIVTCEECLSKRTAMIIESEKYVKE